jgi:hypothetical protein
MIIHYFIQIKIKLLLYSFDKGILYVPEKYP